MNVSESLVQTGLLGEAVDDAPVLVLVADEHGKYLAVSRHACEVLGYTRDELLGLSVLDVARYEGAEDEFAAVVAGGHDPRVVTLTCKDGSKVEFSCRTAEVHVAGLTLYVAIGFTG